MIHFRLGISLRNHRFMETPLLALQQVQHHQLKSLVEDLILRASLGKSSVNGTIQDNINGDLVASKTYQTQISQQV